MKNRARRILALLLVAVMALGLDIAILYRKKG